MSVIEYVRDEDRQEYRRFCAHHLPRFGRSLPTELWHYTNAESLIGILKTGQIWSTQVTCVNDNLEQRYFGDLVHDAVREQRAKNTDPMLGVMLRVADEALANRDFTTASHFVACFSEVEDDLGQWRGYGSGECGYAIGFLSDRILEAIKTRPSARLLPMNYDDSTHSFLVNEVMRAAEVYFRDGLSRGLEVERWAREFLVAFSFELDIFACIIKHPKFFGEIERRITTHLQPGEHKRLEFRQKRTLLARHLPIDLTIPVKGVARLPITRIYVGPGSRQSQRITKISIGDLLAKYGYSGVQIDISKVPYRVP
jgi:hypothetical protein